MARTKRKVNPLRPAAMASETQQRIYHVGGYARLSIEDSGKPGTDTIETQRGLVESYINSQPDLQLYRLYCDNGRSGTNFDRPAFEQMMEDVRTGKIDCIVVKDLSRFGRNYLETGNYLERIFPVLDIRFIAINDNFDTLTAERSSDGYMIPLKNIINAVYSRDISRKISSAFQMKRQNGEFIGAFAPYGYWKCADNPHRFEPNEETAPVVRDIFQWRSEGVSCQQIARRLNDTGIPSPYRYLYLRGCVKAERYKNAHWQQQTVKAILTDETYLGHLVQGCKRSNVCEGIKQTRVPKPEWIIVRNTHEPLVDEEIFSAVQKITEEAAQRYRERLGRHDKLGTTPNILRGLIFCADCKRPLVRYKSVTNGGKNRYYVFICQTHSANLAACPKKYLHETQLKEVLWDTLQHEIGLAGDFEKLVQEHLKSSKTAQQKELANRELASVKQALDRAGTLYDSLYQNYVDRLMTEQEYAEMKQKYRDDMERAKTRLAELVQQEKFRHQQTAQNPWLTACGQFRDEKKLTEEMAHALIERVEVDAANHIMVILRYQDEYRALASLLKSEGQAVPV